MTGDKKLSIIHISTLDMAGGAEKVAWRLSAAQRELGHKVHMLVGQKSSNSDFSTAFSIQLDPVVRRDSQQRGYLYYEFQGSHALVSHPLVQQADVIHLHNLHGGYFNPFSLPLLSKIKPVVWTLHDMQSFTGHCAHAFDCPGWKNSCGECPDLNVYPSVRVDATREMLKHKRSIYDSSVLSITTPAAWLAKCLPDSVLADHPVTVIPNGIDTNTFRIFDKASAKQKYGLPQDVLLLGCVANGGALANPWKGGKYMLAAIDMLKSMLPEARFVNIGDPSPSGDPYIINVPPIVGERQMAWLYSTLDIFLFTSIAETLPLVIIEALACGLPVVSFETGGVPEIIRHEKDGFIVEYRNPRALIPPILRLAGDLQLRKQMTLSARKHAVARFDHSRITANYIDTYQIASERWQNHSRTVTTPVMDDIPDIIKTANFIDAYKQVYSGSGQKNNTPNSVDEANLVTASPMKMEDWPKISIVTPSFNQAEFLERCIESVLSQGYPNLEYIIMDGGSTDGSVDIIRKYEKHLSHWQSATDDGHYAAVNDGLRRSSGALMSWINSSDILHPGCLHTVAAVFSCRYDVEWITPHRSMIMEGGAPLFLVDKMPSWSRQRYLEKDYRYIQQEGTFWRRQLWGKAGSCIKTEYDLAADLELWTRFFRHTQLYVVESRLAAFRVHAGQRGKDNIATYDWQAEQILDTELNLFQNSNEQLLPAPAPILMPEIIRLEEKLGLAMDWDPALLNHRGTDLLLAGYSQDAIAYFDTCLQKQPDDFTTLINMANAYIHGEDYQRAIDFAKKALDIKPRDRETTLLLGTAYEKAGNSNRAQKLYVDYNKFNPSDSEINGKINTAPATGQHKESGFLVTAIISTYNSAKYLSGCLNSLAGQTIANQLQIIVVDSGSEQNEKDVAAAFKKTFSNIEYIRTENRETLFQAWNRAIPKASGRYLISADTDNRFYYQALELMVRALQLYPEAPLVYSDIWLARDERDILGNPDYERLELLSYPDFNKLDAMAQSIFPPQTMWRRDLHDRFGMFEEDYRFAGDYHFFLKSAMVSNALHIGQPLGTAFDNPHGLRSINSSAIDAERSKIRQLFYENTDLEVFFPDLSDSTREKSTTGAAFWRLGDNCLFSSGRSEFNLAHRYYQEAIDQLGELPELLQNISIAKIGLGRDDEAIALLDKIPDNNVVIPELQAYWQNPESAVDIEVVAKKCLRMLPEHPIVTAAVKGFHLPIDELATSKLDDRKLQTPIVTAIVSTYNAERFIRGCLSDLEAQTIADRLEIVVVDACSQQSEREIVTEFQQKYDNIVYIRTSHRVGVYEAWNIAIRCAKGKYITNANTDDRRRKDALQKMCQALENDQDVALVYADCWITEKENETFENFTRSSAYCWAEFDLLTLLKGCFLGPQPVWRKSLHANYGYFDETFESAGDWEFWLRIARNEMFMHIRDYMGLYLSSPDSVEHRNLSLSYIECQRIREKYQDLREEVAENRFQKVGDLLKENKVDQALDLLLRILEVCPEHVESICTVADLCEQRGNTNEALSMWRLAAEITPQKHEVLSALQRCEAMVNNSSKSARFPTPDIPAAVSGARPRKEKEFSPASSGAGQEQTSANPEANIIKHSSSVRTILPDTGVNVNGLFEAARLLFSEGRTTDGIKVLSRLLDHSPEHRGAHLLMISAYESLGEFARAEEMRKILKI